MHDVSFLAENNALPAAAALGYDMLLHFYSHTSILYY